MLVLLTTIPSALYEIGLIAWRGQTIGKRVAHVRVVDANGNIPTQGQAAIRWLVIGGAAIIRSFSRTLGILGLFFFVDFLWAAWDPDNQCLHDKAAGTFVIDRKSTRLNSSHTS